QCQQTFGVNMVALVNGRPKTITLKDAIKHYVDHRHEVVVRRTEFDLRKAEERAHILEGLTIALDHLDQVITIIRHSEDTDAARRNLMAGVYPDRITDAQLERLGLPPRSDEPMFELTELQAVAILALRPGRLTPTLLERLGLPPRSDEAMFELTEVQADAILSLRLSRLTGLERQKIEDEYREILQEIERLKSILASRDLRMQIIKDELLDVK